jgi:hypothetical protein
MAYNTGGSTQSSGNNKAERNIRYIDKDFNNFRNSLIEFTKTYFPDTYTDFSPSSPGMMFMEMASYVGDVLSFYQDNQIQETFTQYARQTSNLYELAYMMGYKPKVTGAAVANIDIFQTVPAKGNSSDAVAVPDFAFALNIPSNTIVRSGTGISDYVMENFCDFAVSSSTDPTEVSVFSVNEHDAPSRFLLKKTRSAVSATTSSISFTFGSYEKFPTVNIEDSNIIQIVSCIDDDGNEWYETPYLGQETIFTPQKNLGGDTPYLLKLRKTQNRFTTRFTSKSNLQIQFGSGVADKSDAEIVPNPSNIGSGSANVNGNVAYSPANFTYTNTYGNAPVNKTLTFVYLKGGGIASNASADTITSIDSNLVTFPNGSGGTAERNSLQINNPNAATGGSEGDTPDQIRENSLKMFGSQLRSVTQDDYTLRALSMPGIYGTVGKIYVEPEKIENLNPHSRPATLDMYVLGYNSSKQLIVPSTNFKTNLITYLGQYRMINDSINVKDGFVINIGVDFQIVVRPNYSGNIILAKCIETLKDYFNIDKWQLNQPIFITDINTILDKVEGVQTVKQVDIYNKSGVSSGYSQYSYDVRGATQNNVVYPSKDPSIFEVKYPNSDIRGSITNF